MSPDGLAVQRLGEESSEHVVDRYVGTGNQ
jgi:hypothetical protein